MHVADGPSRRVVVSGLGVISPIGTSKETFWQSLIDGRSGISRPELSAEGDEAKPCAGEVHDFHGWIEDFGLPDSFDRSIKQAIRKALKVMNRETQMAVAAAQQAVADSDLAAAGFDPDRMGVCFGAGNVSMIPEDFVAGIDACTNEQNEFDFSQWGTEGLPQVAPLWLLTCLPNMPACHIAIYNNLQGPNNSITQQEASANLAVGEALGIIADGEADAMLVGATGTTIRPFNMLHAVMEQDVAVSDADPRTVCRPFDRGRTGSVLGEGAAAFVLEEMHSAIGRGAHIYGEIVAVGSSCVVDRARVPHRDAAMSNAMRAALRNAKQDSDSIGHLHAHGLSTQRADIEESHAIREVFGSRADRLPVVAAKSSMGNAGAGSGAMELAASLLALEHGRLFPVLNYEERDPDCPIVPVKSADFAAGDSFLNLNVSPQGQASCVLVKSLQ